MSKTTGITIQGHIVKTIFPVQNRNCISLNGELREIQEYRPDPRFPNVMLHVVDTGAVYHSVTNGEPFPCDENASNEELTSYAVDQIAHSILGLQELLKSICQSKDSESTLKIRLCTILQEILEVSISSVHTGHQYCKYGFKVPASASKMSSPANIQSKKLESNSKDLESNLSSSTLNESDKVDLEATKQEVALLPLPDPPKVFNQPKTIENKVIKSKIRSSGIPISGHIETFMFVMGGKKCVSVKASLHEVQIYLPAPSQPSISLEVIEVSGEYYSVSHGIPIDLHSPLDIDDFLSGCVFHTSRNFCLLRHELSILQDSVEFSALSDNIQMIFELIVETLHKLHSRFIGAKPVAASSRMQISKELEVASPDGPLSLLERMEALEIRINRFGVTTNALAERVTNARLAVEHVRDLASVISYFIPYTDTYPSGKGILHFLGTNLGRQAWTNPAKSGKLCIHLSHPLQDPSLMKKYHILDAKKKISWQGVSNDSSWFCIDFGEYRARPTHLVVGTELAMNLSIRCGIQASNGSKYTEIKSRYPPEPTKSHSLKSKSESRVLALDVDEFYRFWKFVGCTSSSGGLEFFGSLLHVGSEK